MKWESSKDISAVLEGVTVETEHIKYENKIRRVKITDAKGNVIQISHPDCNDYSALVVEVPCKPEKIRKYKLTGIVKKLPVDETFDAMHEANTRKSELEALLGYDPIFLSEAGLDIQEVMVEKQ